MSDPFSVAAGVAGVLSLGIQISEGLYKFYTAYKERDKSIARAVKELGNLTETLLLLQRVLADQPDEPRTHDVLKNVHTNLDENRALIGELQDEYVKLTSTKQLNSDTSSALRTVGRRALYPFRDSTLAKIRETISELNLNLQLSLEVLQVQLQSQIHDDLSDVKGLLSQLQLHTVSSENQTWLNASDPYSIHSAAVSKRHKDTGSWLLQSRQFQHWLETSPSYLWLNGFAGCGKSILCSTAIQYTLSYKQSKPESNIAVAFFYFTFTDQGKQSASDLLRCLVLQLSAQTSEGPKCLGRHRKCTLSPSVTDLLQMLKELCTMFVEIYVLVDALDESPRGQRHLTLEALNNLRLAKVDGLHLLVTSRDENDVRDALQHPEAEQVLLENAYICHDIDSYVTFTLESRHGLRKWKHKYEYIRDTLTSKAGGVFRWVDCQLSTLEQCPKSDYHLEHCLQALPKTLDETYERILCAIDSLAAPEARRLLMLLSFCSRPLDIAEIIDGLAINLAEPAQFDRTRKLQDTDDLREICPTLVYYNHVSSRDRQHRSAMQSGDQDLGQLTANIAHFSVTEYLKSDRIKTGRAAFFQLSDASSHTEIARICLIYLLDDELAMPQVKDKVVRNDIEAKELKADLCVKLKEFSFYQYAAKNWHWHYERSGCIDEVVEGLILQLFVQHPGNFSNYTHAIEQENEFAELRASKDTTSCFAAYFGLARLLEHVLLATKDGEHSKDQCESKPRRYGLQLCAACERGHAKIVEYLIKLGADLEYDSFFGKPLHIAAGSGREDIVVTLLESGADGRTPSRYFKNGTCDTFSPQSYPLAVATRIHHTRIVKRLLEAKTDVNAIDILCHMYGSNNSETILETALHIAVINRNSEILTMLLEYGADARIVRQNRCVSRLGDLEMVITNGQNYKGLETGDALELARQYGRDEFEEVLTQHDKRQQQEADQSGTGTPPLTFD